MWRVCVNLVNFPNILLRFDGIEEEKGSNEWIMSWGIWKTLIIQIVQTKCNSDVSLYFFIAFIICHQFYFLFNWQKINSFGYNINSFGRNPSNLLFTEQKLFDLTENNFLWKINDYLFSLAEQNNILPKKLIYLGSNYVFISVLSCLQTSFRFHLWILQQTHIFTE